ncbi:uncharacterized protein MELLADRAFT_86341 [Melampsora larici-populina 98AG31]|uniref:Uncharacterized protein n=1 Tax=Melampsora larici-populina (strain 98AG31 / pathotype 3-4-7) TaxID=747676 RepID=F4SDN3_MELLP|nr:uncharacterized protein MELLADRAFT_86341 [Melampsora larici-populina 98AG31]EGF97245.1 hypothetical protein MELLADRAFT_86341 [Melampsora larici-populina 98AG31]
MRLQRVSSLGTEIFYTFDSLRKMKFQKIFVTINMLMNHTALSSVIPQLEANSAKQLELADPSACGSSGVVYSGITQAYNQKLEHAAQMEAQAEKEFGTLSRAIHHDRDLIEFQPPTEFAPQAPGVIPSPMMLTPAAPGGIPSPMVFTPQAPGVIPSPMVFTPQAPGGIPSPMPFTPPHGIVRPPTDPNFPAIYAREFWNDASDDHKYKYIIGGAVAVIHTFAAALYSLMDHVRYERH